MNSHYVCWKFYWQSHTCNLWHFLSRCLAELETLVKKPICSQLKSIFVAEVRAVEATKMGSSYFYSDGCWSSNCTINCLQLWLLLRWQRMCLGLGRKLCCMLVHNDYAVYTPDSPKHISATSRLLDEAALICSLFFIICFTELVTCISVLFSQLNTIETMVMICLLTRRLHFRHVSCSVSIDKIKDAHRFEKNYYLPMAANILLPSVTSNERISVAKIHLPDLF